MNRLVFATMPLLALVLGAVASAGADPAPAPANSQGPDRPKGRELRENAKARREEAREARKEHREEMRGASKERREELRKALKERREEFRGALKERRTQVVQNAEERRKAFLEAVRQRSAEIHEAAEAFRKDPEQGMKHFHEKRAARRAIQRARIRRAWGKVYEVGPVRAELNVHAWRMARLERARFLADAGKKEQLLTKIDELTNKEVTRHRERMEELTKDMGKSPSTAPSASANTPEEK